MDKFLVIDGNSLLNRAYYAFGGRGEIGELSFGGMPTNAVYGFLNMFIKAATDLKVKYICVAFDMRQPTFRHQMFKGYKANRHKMPDDLAIQFDQLKDILKTMQVKIYQCAGYEADDIIGTIAKQAKNVQVINLTADRDGLQLVAPNVELHLTKTGVTNLDVWTVERIQKEYGLSPRQLIDVKALMGDKSDNIPGAMGVGEKTAVALVQKYGSVEAVIEAGANKKVNDSVAMVQMSRKLAEINCQVPIEFHLEDCPFVFPFNDDVKHKFEQAGFKSLLRRNFMWVSGATVEQPISTLFANVKDESKVLDEAVTPILRKMSANGVKVNVTALDALGTDLENEIAALEREIYALAGETFNVKSTQELSDVLQRKLGVNLTKKTKTGYSTNEEVLTELAPSVPLAAKVLEYRGKYKLYSTYVRGYGNAVDLEGLIHTTFNIDKTATGRLSSSEPNLQNIPQRKIDSDRFRQIFVSRFPNGKMLSADYSQIELRLLAALSGENSLIDAFNRGEDIHRETAEKMFGDPERRREAKTVNFGIIYGISSFGLAKDLHCTFHEAAAVIKNYFATFPKVKSFLDQCVACAKQNGYISTMFGRRRYIPELYSNNNNVVAFATRAAMNMPMQGSAADIIKKAMINIDHEMTERGLKSLMVLQIHDELVFDCVPEEIDVVSEIIKRHMEGVVQLPVKLAVNISVDTTL
ncbi:MAG: DNA polymerase [Clostridia bacterium]|nr:DNA polymerase [Clostridia bacterium]